MTKQVQYTTEFAVVDGGSGEFRRIMHSIIESVKENEPDLVAYQVYFGAGENRAFIVEWFKNSDAILTHLANIGPRFPELLAVAPVVRLEVFGNLTKEAADALRSIGAKIFDYHDGFIRGEAQV